MKKTNSLISIVQSTVWHMKLIIIIW